MTRLRVTIFLAQIAAPTLSIAPFPLGQLPYDDLALQLPEGLLPPGALQVEGVETLVPMPELKFEVVGALTPKNPQLHVQFALLDPNDPVEFMRGLYAAGYGLIDPEFGAINPNPGVQFQFGKYGPVVKADELTPVVMPKGPAELRARIATLVTNADNTVTLVVNILGLKIEVGPDTPVKLKHDIQVENKAKPPCNCTPWAGVLGGTVGGAQKVVAGGGANGEKSCEGTAEVHITGPGVNATLKPGETRRTFDPAPDGVWTVTTTVCGLTKTVSITLP